MAQKSLGVSQAAALDYHGGIRARPFDIVRPNACPLLLVPEGGLQDRIGTSDRRGQGRSRSRPLIPSVSCASLLGVKGADGVRRNNFAPNILF